MTKTRFAVYSTFILVAAGLSIQMKRTLNQVDALMKHHIETNIVESAPDHSAKEAPTVADPKKPKLKIVELKLDPARTLGLFGEVTETMGEQLSARIRLMDDGVTPIVLLINSPGSVLAGSQIVTAVQESKSPVYTVCVSLCASMAFVVHQYGDQRYMMNRSMLMAHLASTGSQGDVEKIYSFITALRGYLDKMDEFIAKRAKISLQDYRVRQASEIWIDSDLSFNQHFSDATVVIRLSDNSQLPSPVSEGSGEEHRRSDNKPKVEVNPSNPERFDIKYMLDMSRFRTRK